MISTPLNRTVLGIWSDNNPASHTRACKYLNKHLFVKAKCYMRLVHFVRLGILAECVAWPIALGIIISYELLLQEQLVVTSANT